MKYVQFNTLSEAETYLPKLQANSDAHQIQGQPKVINKIFNAPDGKPTLTLLYDDYPDVGSGEVVDSIEPAIEPMIEE
jgi:hypothetical protein